MNAKLYQSIVIATATMGGLATPAIGQEAPGFRLEEVVVTARRREERLQEVPISMTVFTQEHISNANVVNAGDLALYTPSLNANTRLGNDLTSFAIRGFSQELRTTASVGVFFAEVVAPRGSNTQQSGDGAGPGDFFDLENIQVLKGPQGTLFGRNTTGGAVMLTPRKPIDEFEGYVEGSVGNFDMRRIQGVINIPFTDSVRLRFGIDSQKREGYLKNILDIGPRDFADIDYTALRASMVVDITDSLENYTIIKALESENNGQPGSILVCNPAAGFGSLCAGDLARRAETGNDGFFQLPSSNPDPFSKQDSWQVINTTTWQINDRLTAKNIFSYVELETHYNNMLYGTDWQVPIFSGAPFASPIVGSQELIFAYGGTRDGQPNTDQRTMVEEIQLQGTALDDRLTWQGGLYYEKSKPKGLMGTQSPGTISCDHLSTRATNPADFRCNDLFAVLTGNPVGSVTHGPHKATYTNKAAYFQGTYDFTQQWSATAGIRYTHDKTEGFSAYRVYRFPGSLNGGYFPPVEIDVDPDIRNPRVTSKEPTWLLGIDYQHSENALFYGKYARGYRQGSVNTAAPDGLNTHGPEKVDAYEMGAKLSFHAPIPGTFNVAIFYNDFQDQQIQFSMLLNTGVGTTSIVNAGKSRIQGVEVESTLQFTDNLMMSLSYAYLDTEIKKLTLPQVSPELGSVVGVTGAVGEPLAYTPEHSLVLTANYRLPVDARWGEMVASATYVYTDKQQAVSRASSPFAVLPSYEVVNLNFNWREIAGGPVDLSLFATNALNEKYVHYLSGNWNTGLEQGNVGLPRMYGLRLRYNF